MHVQYIHIHACIDRVSGGCGSLLLDSFFTSAGGKQSQQHGAAAAADSSIQPVIVCVYVCVYKPYQCMYIYVLYIFHVFTYPTFLIQVIPKHNALLIPITIYLGLPTAPGGQIFF